MKTFIIASTSALAMFALAACSDTDTTTTQGVPDDPAMQTNEPAMTQEPAQTDDLAPEAPAVD